MYYITKSFEVPIGHRLSKLTGSKCVFCHGHNFKIEVTAKSNSLNKNDMVMDFSDLKTLVNSLIEKWDHGMFLNENDPEVNNIKSCRLTTFSTDPTAEVLCKYLFDKLNEEFLKMFPIIRMHSVSIWEMEDSKATYLEEIC